MKRRAATAVAPWTEMSQSLGVLDAGSSSSLCYRSHGRVAASALEYLHAAMVQVVMFLFFHAVVVVAAAAVVVVVVVMAVVAAVVVVRHLLLFSMLLLLSNVAAVVHVVVS